MTQKEMRKLKKTERLEMMIALRNELDRVQAERDALQEQLKTAEQITQYSSAMLLTMTLRLPLRW